jgi:NitT/TauT family transport system ATP-binding protein
MAHLEAARTVSRHQLTESPVSVAGPGTIAQMSGVSKVFRRGRAPAVSALHGVSLALAVGEVVAIIGPSGCGKSTTLRLVGGMVTPTEGQISVSVPRSAAAEGGLSMMFQVPALLDWRTAEGNVTLPLETRSHLSRHARHERARDMLRLVGLGDAMTRHPFELSGGMQQRVALARALITDPKLLLLDEPFGALDAITRDEMCLQLARVCEDRGAATLLVTHSITEAIFLADRIVVMSRRPGRIIAEFAVPLPRPRQVADRLLPEALQLERELLSLLVGAGDAHGRKSP